MRKIVLSSAITSIFISVFWLSSWLVAINKSWVNCCKLTYCRFLGVEASELEDFELLKDSECSKGTVLRSISWVWFIGVEGSEFGKGIDSGGIS